MAQGIRIRRFAKCLVVAVLVLEAGMPVAHGYEPPQFTPGQELMLAKDDDLMAYFLWCSMHDVDPEKIMRAPGKVVRYDAATGSLAMIIDLPESMAPTGQEDATSELTVMVRPISNMYLWPDDLQAGEAIWYYFSIKQVEWSGAERAFKGPGADAVWQAVAVRRAKDVESGRL